jgi:hypothetical protein
MGRPWRAAQATGEFITLLGGAAIALRRKAKQWIDAIF